MYAFTLFSALAIMILLIGPLKSEFTSLHLDKAVVAKALFEANCRNYFHATGHLNVTDKGEIDSCDRESCRTYVFATCTLSRNNQERDVTRIFWDIVDGKAVFLPFILEYSTKPTPITSRYNVHYDLLLSHEEEKAIFQNAKFCNDPTFKNCEASNIHLTSQPLMGSWSLYNVVYEGYYYQFTLNLVPYGYTIFNLVFQPSNSKLFVDLNHPTVVQDLSNLK